MRACVCLVCVPVCASCACLCVRACVCFVCLALCASWAPCTPGPPRVCARKCVRVRGACKRACVRAFVLASQRACLQVFLCRCVSGWFSGCICA